MSERRSYSDEEKAEALAALDANEGDILQTSGQLDIPRKTLEYWARGHAGKGAANLRQAKKEDLADALERVARLLINAIPDKIANAPLQAVATSAAIAVDKMRLLREQPTSINRDDGLTDADRVAGVAALVQRVRSRGTGQPDPTGPAVN